MKKSNAELVEQFASFIPFVQSLREVPEPHWKQPLAEGKWSIHDIIAHIYFWDRYFFEEAIAMITRGEPLTLQHLDFDTFNQNSVKLGRVFPSDELIRLTLFARNQIVDQIRNQTDEYYTQAYKDGDGKRFTVRSYLMGFVPHDAHHKKQIEQFLAKLN